MEEKNNKLDVGEKYLSIKLTGHDYVKAFPNKNKTKTGEPDYKGDGIAVWIQTKQPPKEKVEPGQPLVEAQQI